jgi:ribosomal protein L16 Arg81 hydroxylase
LEAQVREVSRLEDLLTDEEDKNERLKEKIRLLKRGSGHEGYRTRFEEKVLEVELLRQRLAEREELVRLAETRVAEKNRTILYFKNYLRTHGFRVED